MISNIDQRVLFWDDSASSFTDITKEVNTYDTGSASLTFDTGDYLYIGSFFPINHKFFKITANVTAASPTVEVFGASSWDPVVDILDYTESSGTSFAQTGILQFTPDRDESWNMVTDTSEEAYLTEFQNGPVIYNKYWIRLSFDTPGVSTDLSYVGSMFANESDVFAEYSHLRSSTLLDMWETGKTDWEEQRVLASEYVVTDLKKRSIIIERSQILDISILQEPCVHKTAAMIFSGLGPKNYESEIENALKRYSNAINLQKFEVDANANGQKDRGEQTITTRRMSR